MTNHENGAWHREVIPASTEATLCALRDADLLNRDHFNREKRRLRAAGSERLQRMRSRSAIRLDWPGEKLTARALRPQQAWASRNPDRT
jgi:hypothetical protein